MNNTEPPRHLIVIGGGIGGYTAAIRAARHGLQVTLIESGALGGTCLNVGCIPTKSLLHQAKAFRQAADMGHFGVDPSHLRADIGAILRKKSQAVEKLVRGVQTLVRSNRITLVVGHAKFVDPHTVQVLPTGTLLRGDLLVVASGSEPIVPPIPGITLPGVVTSDGALAMTELPRRVLIMGGGVIGVEFAQIFSSFGAQVTVVEKLDRVLSEEDADVTKVLQRCLEQQGVRFLAACAVQSIAADAQHLKVQCIASQGTSALEADMVLVAVGRRPRFAALALEQAGVSVHSGAIATDARCRTNQSHIYAVGDARGGMLLAHKAAADAECAVADMTGHPWSMEGRVVPRAVYTHPEIAAVGLTEVQANAAYPQLKIGRFPFAASGKAIANEDVNGFVKVMADGTTGQVVGISMVGADVTSLLGEATLAVQMELTLVALMQTIHAHPTLTEALAEAAHDAHNHGAIHLPPKVQASA